MSLATERELVGRAMEVSPTNAKSNDKGSNNVVRRGWIWRRTQRRANKISSRKYLPKNKASGFGGLVVEKSASASEAEAEGESSNVA